METKQFYKSRAEHLATRTEKPSTWNTKNRQPVKKTKEINGRPLPYMVTETVDQVDVTDSYNINSFTIENLQDIGMDKKLPLTFAHLGTLQIIDSLDKGAAAELDRMDAEEWAAKYLKNNNPKQENKEE